MACKGKHGYGKGRGKPKPKGGKRGKKGGRR
jgi:hypothetical protein